MIEINLAAALIVLVVVVVVTIVLAIRIGFGTAAKFVASLLTSPVIMAAISSLEKSVPATVVDILLGGLDLGEATTTNADFKALLDAIEELIKQNKVTQSMLAQSGLTITSTTPLKFETQTGSAPLETVVNISAPKDAESAGVG